jgi:hypothetical protein
MQAGRHLPRTVWGWLAVLAVLLVGSALLVLAAQGDESVRRKLPWALMAMWGLTSVNFLRWLLARRRGQVG